MTEKEAIEILIGIPYEELLMRHLDMLRGRLLAARAKGYRVNSGWERNRHGERYTFELGFPDADY